MTSTPAVSAPSGPVGTPPARPGRVAAMVVGLVLVVSGIGYGCFTLVALLTRHDSTFDRRVAGPIRAVSFQADAGSGAVTVSGTAPPGLVTVHATISSSWGDRRFDAVLQRDGTLTVTIRCGQTVPLGCTGHLRLTVPAAVSLTGSSSDGGIRVVGVHGSIRVHSSDGGVAADDTRGDLDLSTSDGAVRATRVRSARVTASSSDGGVSVGFAAPPTNVHATSGDGGVRVALPARSGPYAVTVGSSDGGTHTRVRTDPGSPLRIYAHTGDGGVTVAYG